VSVGYVRYFSLRPDQRGIWWTADPTWNSWSLDFKIGISCNWSDPRRICLGAALGVLEVVVEINRGPRGEGGDL
jgi:hypothetical protein